MERSHPATAPCFDFQEAFMKLQKREGRQEGRKTRGSIMLLVCAHRLCGGSELPYVLEVDLWNIRDIPALFLAQKTFSKQRWRFHVFKAAPDPCQYLFWLLTILITIRENIGRWGGGRRGGMGGVQIQESQATNLPK